MYIYIYILLNHSSIIERPGQAGQGKVEAHELCGARNGGGDT